MSTFLELDLEALIPPPAAEAAADAPAAAVQAAATKPAAPASQPDPGAATPGLLATLRDRLIAGSASGPGALMQAKPPARHLRRKSTTKKKARSLEAAEVAYCGANSRVIAANPDSELGSASADTQPI